MSPFVAGVFVACAVVTLMRWLKIHDRRLLPLMGLFLMLAAAESVEWWHRWRDAFLLAAAAFGLVLVPMLDRRQHGRAPQA